MLKAWTGKRKRGWVGIQRVPFSANAPAGTRAVEMEVGIERLVPGVQHHRRAELATQVLLATLAERLAGSAEQQGQEGDVCCPRGGH